jgi:hypothetical protein
MAAAVNYLSRTEEAKHKHPSESKCGAEAVIGWIFMSTVISRLGSWVRVKFYILFLHFISHIRM